jgi:hypothetical protein
MQQVQSSMGEYNIFSCILLSAPEQFSMHMQQVQSSMGEYNIFSCILLSAPEQFSMHMQQVQSSMGEYNIFSCILLSAPKQLSDTQVQDVITYTPTPLKSESTLGGSGSWLFQDFKNKDLIQRTKEKLSQARGSKV